MKPIIAATILGLACGCGYSHIAATATTFNQLAPAQVFSPNETQGGPLVLKISRQLDTVMSGPDTEEDQFLVLEVRNYRLNQKLPVPSEWVTPRFTVARSGPRSTGTEFRGYLILRKIETGRLTAYLHIDVTAKTADGSYVQTAKFHGEQKFYRGMVND